VSDTGQENGNRTRQKRRAARRAADWTSASTVPMMYQPMASPSVPCRLHLSERISPPAGHPEKSGWLFSCP